MSSDQLDKKSQAWSALFSEPMSELVKRYTSSVFFDKRLWKADITGSLAHAEMLCHQKVISAQDHAKIQHGMAQITREIENNQFEWTGGRCGQAPAHRTLSQRPSGHRCAAVAAR
jgi:argininosuccinate lyase